MGTARGPAACAKTACGRTLVLGIHRTARRFIAGAGLRDAFSLGQMTDLDWSR